MGDSKYGFGLLIGLVVALIVHFYVFAGVNMHSTLHAFIGIALYTLFMGAALQFLGSGKKSRKK